MQYLNKALLFSILFFAGCSYSSHFIDSNSKAYPETNPDEIKLFSGDVDEEYIIIGVVASDILGTGDESAKRIKKEAAKIGADAIIFVKLTKLNSFAQRTGVSGIAIKYQE